MEESCVVFRAVSTATTDFETGSFTLKDILE